MDARRLMHNAPMTYRSTNPAKLDELVIEIKLSNPDEIAAVARAAHAVQHSWADVPAPVRGQVIANIGTLVEANAEALAQLVTREVGKPLAESRGEVQEI